MMMQNTYRRSHLQSSIFFEILFFYHQILFAMFISLCNEYIILDFFEHTFLFFGDTGVILNTCLGCQKLYISY